MMDPSPDSARANLFQFETGGLAIQVRTDPPVARELFHPRFRTFAVPLADKPDLVALHHRFSLPSYQDLDLRDKVYDSPPWIIYHIPEGWLYLGHVFGPQGSQVYQLAHFSEDHTCGQIYTPGASLELAGSWDSLTLFPSDQILLAPLFAARQGCIVHAAGMVIEGQGFLFAGHSDAGKSTLVTLLQAHGEILCDDRIILRRWPEGFRIHGTWSHGDVPDVSPNAAPLRAIFLLEQAPHNRLVPLEDRREIVRRLPFLIVKPLATAGWWEKTLDLVGQVAREVPVYRLQFERSGPLIDLIRSLL
jgi:hypothetical protein